MKNKYYNIRDRQKFTFKCKLYVVKLSDCKSFHDIYAFTVVQYKGSATENLNQDFEKFQHIVFMKFMLLLLFSTKAQRLKTLIRILKNFNTLFS